MLYESVFMLVGVLQEISRLQSELSNLKSQIEMQTNNLKVNDSRVSALQNELNHVRHIECIKLLPIATYRLLF